MVNFVSSHYYLLGKSRRLLLFWGLHLPQTVCQEPVTFVLIEKTHSPSKNKIPDTSFKNTVHFIMRYIAFISTTSFP